MNDSPRNNTTSAIFRFDEWRNTSDGRTLDIRVSGVAVARLQVGRRVEEDGRRVWIYGMLVTDPTYGWARHGSLFAAPADWTAKHAERAAVGLALAMLPGWLTQELAKAAEPLAPLAETP
ncbi:hypothetical protein [Microbispora sp. NPDC049125]|uniref:hypothetical protein n=1 Tax=Microbispora sp. NPDC049125 TaxID=3154929 RepID=UPI003466916D